ncbi:MAG: ABC transporter permease [Halobacteriota archaeon]
MADPRLVIARREWQVLTAEKTIVLALLIQLFVAAFSSFLVVGLVSLYDPASVDGYQVEVAVTGEAREELLATVDAESGIRGVPYESSNEAMSAFEIGRVDAVLAATHRGDRIHVSAAAPDENIRTTLVVVQVRDALRAFERAERDRRAAFLSSTTLGLPPEVRTSPYYGFTYTVLIPLLLFLPVFISGSLTVDSLTEEFDRGTLELLQVAPVSLTDIVDGKLVASTVLAPAQAGLWVLLLRANGTTVDHPWLLLVMVAALAVLVCSLGATIALLAPDRRAAQFLYSVGVLAGFGALALLPGNPANVAARLAVDSAGRGAVVVLGYTVFAVGSYLAVRWLVARIDVAE